ncbi:MAG: hypothetical protein COB78_07545 [Hyphomicrobiales bacterium]|nr:MAG: hypothetical protein COB78_07545 [Hyphomicrobiales bacterium]
MAKNSQQPGENGADDQLDDRLESLQRELKSRRKDERGTGRRNTDATGFSQAMRLSTDFVAAILVGAGLGWAIDRFFGTTPWAMILFLLLGFCAGVLNVMRSAGLVAENRALRPGSNADTKDRNEDN